MKPLKNARHESFAQHLAINSLAALSPIHAPAHAEAMQGGVKYRTKRNQPWH